MSIDDLRHRYIEIDFPEYQREPDVWSREQKQRLIDSILRGFDIASIYLYLRDDGGVECIDGRQRLNAIMSFLGKNPTDELDDGFSLRIHNEISSSLVDDFAGVDSRTFSELSQSDDPLMVRAAETILSYELTVVYLSGAHEPDEFNLQFLRLNLGTLINAGEKLNAMVGDMRNLVFEDLGKHAFFESVRIPTRRYAKEQVAAQVLLQVFARRERGEFARARHSDLQRFLKTHAEVASDPVVPELQNTLDALLEEIEGLSPLLRNRAVTISLVLLAWESEFYNRPDIVSRFAEFVKVFLGRLNWQVDNMKRFEVDDRYSYLVEFQRHLTQASVEKPAVTRRHELLLREWNQWLETGALSGDVAFSEATGEDPPLKLPE